MMNSPLDGMLQALSVAYDILYIEIQRKGQLSSDPLLTLSQKPSGAKFKCELKTKA